MQEFEELADYLPSPQQSYQRNDYNGQPQQHNQNHNHSSNSNNYSANNNQPNTSYQHGNNSGQNRNYNQQNKGNGNYQGKPNAFNKYPKKDEGPLRLYKPYVITGNKETPSNVISRMCQLVHELESFSYTLRTGGLEGPDEAVENAVKDRSLFELYLPWKGFNNKESTNAFNTERSLEIAKMFHPTFDGLKFQIQGFLAKNARMVLGKDMRSPVMFVLLWSEDAAEKDREKTAKTGNVGHIISIASAMHIPVFNMQRPDAEQRLKQYLELISTPNNQGNQYNG